MKAIKKRSIDVSHEGHSPNFLPEIIKLCQDLNEKEAIIYQEEETKPFLFETSRLIIRRFYNDDVTGVHELANDRQESIMKNYDHQWPTDYKECKDVTDWLTTQENMWAVCIKPDFKLIGMITFNSVDENNMVDLGHVWHTKFWNDNLDTEAISLMVQYAFETLEVESVTANNPLECEQQIAPLKKIGMDITNTNEGAFTSDEYGNPIKFVGCNMVIRKEKWNSLNDLYKK